MNETNNTSNLKCYAILDIPDGYVDYLGYLPDIKREFFDISETGFDINNEEGLINYIINVLDVHDFEIYYSILDPDHFKELHKLEEFENGK